MEGLRKLKHVMPETREDFMKRSNSHIYKKTSNARIQKLKASSVFNVILVCLLIVFQLSVIVAPVSAAGDEDSRINLVIGDVGDVLPKGEVFEVDVTIHNDSGKIITVSELNIAKKDGLAPVNSDWKIPADSNISNGDTYTFNVKLVYNGSEDSISLNFSCGYKLDGDTKTVYKTNSKYVFFKTDSSDNTPPTNTAKFEPNIKVKSDIKMPVFKAGENVILNLPIINESIYEARNIVATIDTSNAASLPFTFDQIILASNIDKILAKKGDQIYEDKISYNVKIKADAKDGIYPIKLIYNYSNAYNDSFSTTETIYIKVINDKTPPKLIMENIQTFSSNPTPGNMMSLALTFKNQGSLPANDIKVSLKGLSSDGITTYKSADSKFISKIEGQDKGKVEYALIISEKFTGKNASLQASVEYKDGVGNTYSEDFQFFIRINEVKEEEKEETKPDIIIRDLDFPTEKVKAGDEFKLRFIIDNIGTDIAKNVKVSLTCDEGVLPKSSSVVQIDTLEKDQSKELNFDLFANLGVATKNYLVTINVEYEYTKEDKENKTDKVEKLILTRYAGVYVEKQEEKEEDKEKTVPKIIINMYSFDSDGINAGSNFKLNLSFLNTSKIVPVRNIKVSFSAKDGIFIPASSSNTFFIENLGTQEIAEREVELFTKSDAPPKSHVLNLNFEYEDEKGNQYTAAEEISIPVKQEQKLVIGQLNLPPEGYEGEPIPIFVDFFNMGKSVIYNLMVSFEGEGFRTENANYFAGNFESGRSDYFESMITPTSPGEATGSIVFNYEDESGNKNEVRKEIKFNVMGMQMPSMPSEGQMGEEFPGEMPPEKQQKKLFTPLNIGIAGGVLVIIVIVLIVIIRKRRIRKAGMTFDE